LGCWLILNRRTNPSELELRSFYISSHHTSSRMCSSQIVCYYSPPFIQLPVHSATDLSTLHDFMSPSMPPLNTTCSLLLCGFGPPARENRGPVCFRRVCSGSGHSYLIDADRLHTLMRQSSEAVANIGSTLFSRDITAVTTSKCAPNFLFSVIFF
jgi:hypothetical protein